MIVGKINQIGDFLTTNNTNIANQYAENLKLQIEFDNKYDGYSWLWFCGYSYNQPKALPIAYSSEEQLLILPPEAFKKDGILYVQGVAIKEGVKIPLLPVKFYLGESLPQDFIGTGKSELEALQELIKQIIANEYDATLQVLIQNATAEQLKADEQQALADEHQAEATKQQEKAEEMQAEAERQQEVVNNLIGTSEQQQETIAEQQSKVEELILEATNQQGNVNDLVDSATQFVNKSTEDINKLVTDTQDDINALKEETEKQQEDVNALVNTTTIFVEDAKSSIGDLESEARQQQLNATEQQTKTDDMQNALTISLEEYKRKLDAGEFVPEHKWEGTILYFKHSDGTWDSGTNLQSPDIKILIVSELPQIGIAFTIYFVSKSNTNDDAYDEYMWIEEKWERIGSTSVTVDLSDYVKKSGDTFTGNVTFKNGKYIQGQKVDGTSHNIFGFSSDNNVLIGTPTSRSRIRSLVNPVWDDGTSVHKALITELGGTLTGNLILSNANVKGKNNFGEYNLLGFNSMMDRVEVGETTKSSAINSIGAPIWSNGVVDKEIITEDGGHIRGHLRFNNQLPILSYKSDGTEIQMILVNENNIVEVGDATTPLRLVSSVKPVWNNGTVNKELITVDGGTFTGDVTFNRNVTLKSDGPGLTIMRDTGINGYSYSGDVYRILGTEFFEDESSLVDIVNVGSLGMDKIVLNSRNIPEWIGEDGNSRKIITEDGGVLTGDIVLSNYGGLKYLLLTSPTPINLISVDANNLIVVGDLENDLVIRSNNKPKAVVNGEVKNMLVEGDAPVSDEIKKIKKLTQAQYDALGTKDNTTLYVVVG